METRDPYCDAGWGRWINRDPLADDVFLQNYKNDKPSEEVASLRVQAHEKVYGFLSNGATNEIDVLGLHAGPLMGCDIVVSTKRRDRGMWNWLANDVYEADLTLAGEIDSCTDENVIITVESDPRDVVFMKKNNGPGVYAGADTISGRKYRIGAPVFPSWVSSKPDMKGVLLWKNFGMLGRGQVAAINEARILVLRGEFLSGGVVDMEVGSVD